MILNIKNHLLAIMFAEKSDFIIVFTTQIIKLNFLNRITVKKNATFPPQHTRLYGA